MLHGNYNFKTSIYLFIFWIYFQGAVAHPPKTGLTPLWRSHWPWWWRRSPQLVCCTSTARVTLLWTCCMPHGPPEHTTYTHTQISKHTIKTTKEDTFGVAGHLKVEWSRRGQSVEAEDGDAVFWVTTRKTADILSNNAIMSVTFATHTHTHTLGSTNTEGHNHIQWRLVWTFGIRSARRWERTAAFRFISMWTQHPTQQQRTNRITVSLAS